MHRSANAARRKKRKPKPDFDIDKYLISLILFDQNFCHLSILSTMLFAWKHIIRSRRRDDADRVRIEEPVH